MDRRQNMIFQKHFRFLILEELAFYQRMKLDDDQNIDHDQTYLFLEQRTSKFQSKVKLINEHLSAKVKNQQSNESSLKSSLIH